MEIERQTLRWVSWNTYIDKEREESTTDYKYKKKIYRMLNKQWMLVRDKEREREREKERKREG